MSGKTKVNKFGHGKSDHLKNLTEKYVALSLQCFEKGLSLEETKDLALSKGSYTNGNAVKSVDKCKLKKEPWSRKKKLFLGVVVIGILSAGLAYALEIRSLTDLKSAITMESSNCLIYNSGAFLEVFRPLMNCAMCRYLRQVPIERSISVEEFRKKYAYTGVPVLIKDATNDWSAMSTFSFHYFKELYEETEGALESVQEECQFFPYKTEFDTLADVFNMSDDRANFKEGEKPWYIGW